MYYCPIPDNQNPIAVELLVRFVEFALASPSEKIVLKGSHPHHCSHNLSVDFSRELMDILIGPLSASGAATRASE